MLGFSKRVKNPQISKDEVEQKLRHIAFIMDGNGRWAKKRGLPRKAGHKYGAENLRRVANRCKELGIKAITVYAFSTENWSRPKDEVDSIMRLLCNFCDEAVRDREKNKIRFVFLGDKAVFDSEMRDKLEKLEEMTADYEHILNIALNYGARDELVHSVNSLIAEGKESVTEQDISSRLYTSHVPDPDLIVRTGGDFRISNFLLWQAAYAELCFTKTLWPDLDEREIDRIVADFLTRDRRYGNVK
ncbi:MAG: di-trans,poly-cis-decaprenylcistransferase [Clostridia bacterium]|nr:di-trans,poly-cis-decaprenylcistransferase [Clostridia bacterium]